MSLKVSYQNRPSLDNHQGWISNSLNYNNLHTIRPIFGFSESLQKALSDDIMFSSIILTIVHAFLSKTASKMTFDFSMPSERAASSDNYGAILVP